MPTLENGKTKNNIINHLDSFIDEVTKTGSGLIAGNSYKNRHTYYNLNNVYVTPDSRGDDLYMVNYQNGIDFVETDEANLRSTLIRYMNSAIAMHATSKATVSIKRNASGRYELDNMRLYDNLSEAKQEGYKNRSNYVTSVSTGKNYPLSA